MIRSARALLCTALPGFVVSCAAVPGGEGGSVLHISRDGGRAWTEPGWRRRRRPTA